MSEHSHPDCKDKDSVHYFMCHMTQKEFEEMCYKYVEPSQETKNSDKFKSAMKSLNDNEIVVEKDS